MYHLELRQFPHKTNDFNVSKDALRAIVDPWVRGEYVELGERYWAAHEAKLTILEGPELAMGELSLGRGWANATRKSTDVTERVLGAASDFAAATSATPADMLALLGANGVELLHAWRKAAADAPGARPSETLAVAEAALPAVGGEGQ